MSDQLSDTEVAATLQQMARDLPATDVRPDLAEHVLALHDQDRQMSAGAARESRRRRFWIGGVAAVVAMAAVPTAAIAGSSTSDVPVPDGAFATGAQVVRGPLGVTVGPPPNSADRKVVRNSKGVEMCALWNKSDTENAKDVNTLVANGAPGGFLVAGRENPDRQNPDGSKSAAGEEPGSITAERRTVDGPLTFYRIAGGHWAADPAYGYVDEKVQLTNTEAAQYAAFVPSGASTLWLDGVEGCY